MDVGAAHHKGSTFKLNTHTAMASVSMPIPIPGKTHPAFESPSDMSATNRSPHCRKASRNLDLPPLPVFSFNPGESTDQSSEQARSQSPTHPILEEMASRSESKRAARPTALPAFTFNPGADAPPEPSPSPTHPILEEMAQNSARRSARPVALSDLSYTPVTGELRLSPSPTKSSFGDVPKAAGHRRNGSEYVGGGSDGHHLNSPTFISSSPSKADQLKAAPSSSGSFERPTHRHRRSEAVSISNIDASELIRANAIAKHRAGSTPSTPSDTVQPAFFTNEHSPGTNKSISGPVCIPNTSSPRGRRESAPGVRPRVGFSETVDVIPRPLSLISSETEGSTSTVRGTHSLNGSINSLATSSPTPQPISPGLRSPKDDSPRRRPNTADAASPSPTAVSDFAPSGSVIRFPKRPLSSSGAVEAPSGLPSPPPKKKHYWFIHSSDSSPKTTPKAELPDPIAALPAFAPATVSTASRPKTSPERAASIKRRKVRKWTGHLFSRKDRQQILKAKGRRTPTPPMLAHQDTDRLNEIFDTDDTIVLREDPILAEDGKSAQDAATVEQNQPQSFYFDSAERMTSPLLDLDAALGPFGSEEKFGDNEHNTKGAASRMARLHSSERRGPVDAFGSLHRRSESAPQMPPVNRNLFGVHRLGSSTSLADDVFDEEEEDNFLAKEHEPEQTNIAMEPVNALQPGTTATDPSPQQLRDVGQQDRRSSTGLGLAIAYGEADGVEILDTEDDLSPGPARSSNSTITAPVLTEADPLKRPASPPMEFLYGAPQSIYASSTEGPTAPNSAVSSPEPEHVSFQSHPRFNRYAGEQHLDVILRGSTDDLPSLSDSVSTGILPRFSSSAATRSSTEQRAASFCAQSVPNQSQTSKRWSVASLNKLIPGSTNGSKLKLEETATPFEAEKTKKKTNRFSKLVNFWRSKERGEK